jgi:hypothetical protein
VTPALIMRVMVAVTGVVSCIALTLFLTHPVAEQLLKLLEHVDCCHHIDAGKAGRVSRHIGYLILEIEDLLNGKHSAPRKLRQCVIVVHLHLPAYRRAPGRPPVLSPLALMCSPIQLSISTSVIAGLLLMAGSPRRGQRGSGCWPSPLPLRARQSKATLAVRLDVLLEHKLDIASKRPLVR